MQWINGASQVKAALRGTRLPGRLPKRLLPLKDIGHVALSWKISRAGEDSVGPW